MIFSQSIEDYLKSIYEIKSKSEKVTTSFLSEKLDVAPASVTNMIKSFQKKSYNS